MLYRGMSSQDKWHETPYTRWPILKSFGQLLLVLVTFFHVSHENQEIGHLIKEPNIGKVTIGTWGGQVKVLMFILGS